MKLIFMFLLIINFAWTQDIQLSENATKTIRLKSVLNSTRNETTLKRQIVWMFKRLYAVWPAQLEKAQTDTMISLDTEVQSNLNKKYAIDSDSFDLIVNNLTYADSGLYVCNQWNHKTIYYQLIVNSPITKPDLITDLNLIPEMNNITMKCVSKHAYPYPMIKWYHNDKELNDSVISLINKEENIIESELKLVNVTNSFHLNKFTCKLKQNGFELTSEQINLNIGFKPIVNIDSNRLTSKKFILYDDSEIIFKCNYKSNPNDVKIEWRLNNITQITDLNEFNWLNRSNRYDLTNKQMNLTCRVVNSIGTGQDMIQITLIHEPIVFVEKTLYEADELSKLEINCHIDASPPPNLIEWRHYSNETTQTGVVVSTNQLLEFKSIKHTETNGYYVCSAQNEMIDSFGKRKKTSRQSLQIEINVKFIPQLNLINKKLAVNLTSTKSQNITCLTLANPLPNFNWYKNGNKINTLIQTTKYMIGDVLIKSRNVYENVLTINNLNDFDLTNYECEAINQLGKNKLKIELLPLSRPDKPTELRTIYTDFMTISLAWSSSFNGGLPQTFQIKLNDSVVNLTDTGNNVFNLTNLNYATLYSIKIRAENQIGASEWSDAILSQTNDLTTTDSYLIPTFDSLFLNVPKNRLEFKFNPILETTAKFCLKLSTRLDKCIPVVDLITRNQFSLNDLLDETNKTIQFSKVKSLRVSICFQMKETICSFEPFNAIIDTYNKMSHSSVLFNKHDFKSTTLSNEAAIPVSLITGICVCILTLLVILFVSVLYCIRRRNFKLCKNLLNTNELKNEDDDSKKKSTIERLRSTFDPKSHTNKSFNVDLPSSSSGSTNNSTSDGYGSGSGDLNLVNASSTSTGSLLNSNLTTKRTFVSAISSTANHLINNTLSRNRQSEILVTEDEEQQEKMKSNKRMSKMISNEENSSTGVSNCSSSLNNNNNGIYIYSDLNYNDQIDSNSNDLYNKGMTYMDTYNTGTTSGASSGASNTDPIAINNSLSSNNSSVDSPTYGYNLAAATITNNNPSSSNLNQYHNENASDLIYIKNGCLMVDNFVQIDETVNSYKQATLLRQQQNTNRHNSYMVNSNTNMNQYNETPESGYSTPSRPKKVVYEVIV